jgi:hypothetical protein
MAMILSLRNFYRLALMNIGGGINSRNKKNGAILLRRKLKSLKITEINVPTGATFSLPIPLNPC